MLCYLLLYNKVNQLYMYIFPSLVSLLPMPAPHPIPSGHQRATELSTLGYAAASH